MDTQLKGQAFTCRKADPRHLDQHVLATTQPHKSAFPARSNAVLSLVQFLEHL